MSGIDNNWADQEAATDWASEHPEPDEPDPSEYADLGRMPQRVQRDYHAMWCRSGAS